MLLLSEDKSSIVLNTIDANSLSLLWNMESVSRKSISPLIKKKVELTCNLYLVHSKIFKKQQIYERNLLECFLFFNEDFSSNII